MARKTVFAAAAMMILAAAPALAQGGAVDVTGLAVAPEREVRQVLGVPPAEFSAAQSWAIDATRRLVRWYVLRGYELAQAWYRVEPDGRVRVDVDEGRVESILFPNASPDQSVLYRLILALPENVFHRGTVDGAMAELRNRFGLRRARWRIVESDVSVPTRLGPMTVVRSLRVETVSEESWGWDGAVELDASHGVVAGVRWRGRNLAVDGDRLRVVVDVAIPWRQYLFQAEPEFQWVHGEVATRYGLPAFAKGRLAPSFEAAFSFSRLERQDVGLDSWLAMRWSLFGELTWFALPELRAALGLGVDDVRVLAPRASEGREAPSDRGLLRGDLRVSLLGDLTPDEPRRNRKRTVQLRTALGVSGPHAPLWTTVAEGRFGFGIGFHDFLFAARGIYLAGGVHFYDQVALAGSYQRAFLGNRFWVREAFQAEAAFRGSIWREQWKLGLFVDGSVFGDATRGRAAALATAVGPSLHWQFLDQFQLDVFYAFGWGPGRFGHNLSFALGSIF